jgi:hypothetical protein
MRIGTRGDQKQIHNEARSELRQNNQAHREDRRPGVLFPVLSNLFHFDVSSHDIHPRRPVSQDNSCLAG